MLQINMADVVAVINSLVPYLVTAGVLLLPESLPSNARMIIVCRMDSTRITSLRLRCSFREPAPTSSEFSERRRTIPMQIVCMERPLFSARRNTSNDTPLPMSNHRVYWAMAQRRGPSMDRNK